MAVKETTIKFKSSDGREFDNKAEAERHDELILARGQYDEARRRFNAAIVVTQKTADGEDFDTGVFRNYYYVSKPFFSMPALESVCWIGWYFEVREHDDAVMIISRPGTESDNRHSREYPIAELYRDKRKAMTALFQARREWLAEQAERIDADEKEWNEKV